MNVAPVLGPRRNRRTGGRMTRAGRQGWRPEAKRDRDVESSRPQAAGREVSAVRSTDFMEGRGD
ncbi:hypothetical protein C3709_11470 [Lelliottia aquatilis]|nr:hypothetical protein C3710_09695 [Lelliottia aquatilis]POZ38158.1 hypothetical protein C3709_11470 [Lelliottia aquatilis]